MYETARQEFDSNIGQLLHLTFHWTMRCKEVSDSVKYIINYTLGISPTKDKRTVFRCSRTKNTNKANRFIEELNLYLDELKALIETTPDLSSHPHIVFVMDLAEETVENLKKDFDILDRVGMLVGFEI